MKNRLNEVIKFILTGGVCFLIEYAALIALKEWLHLPVVAATPIAFLISVVFNYLLCVKWVFNSAISAKGGAGYASSSQAMTTLVGADAPTSGRASGIRKAQLGFAITSVMGLFLNWAIMWVLTVLFGEDVLLFVLFGVQIKVYMLNKIIATGLVMVWNYFTKRWLLKGSLH